MAPTLRQRAQQIASELNRRRRFYLAIYRDPRTPWYAKAILWLTLAYAFSPIDLIPDFIPVIGYFDDLLIVPAGIAVAMWLVPREVYTEHRVLLKPELEKSES